MSSFAKVYLWDSLIGAISLEDDKRVVSFEYDRDFLNSGIELSPLHMPLSRRVYSFPTLLYEAFKGLPGMLSDSLPDKFGNAVINDWLARQGRTEDSFNVVERLCYTGKRGMGALEYEPSNGPQESSESVNVSKLVDFASKVLKDIESVHLKADDNMASNMLLKLGTSAGGARAKAIIAWNKETNDIRSGQIDAGKGYEYWLMKFDSVSGNGDHGLEDEPEYTLIEYAYYLMAKDAGITMNECNIFSENGRSHFMTKRFDRGENGEKIHMQTLGALAHIDYNTPGLCGYEQAAAYARKIGVVQKDIEELFRRMVFNVLAINQDDHVKNISFLMNKKGEWSLSPAYDLTYAYNSNNIWLKAHQMTINGKSSGLNDDDLISAGKSMDISSAKCKRIIDEVERAIKKWPEYADRVGMSDLTKKSVKIVAHET